MHHPGYAEDLCITAVSLAGVWTGLSLNLYESFPFGHVLGALSSAELSEGGSFANEEF